MLQLVENITSKEAFSILKREVDSSLIDVRTEKEILTVGAPNLESIGKNVSFIEWTQSFFSNTRLTFLKKFRTKFNIEKKGIFVFICKSGIRSNFAALTVEESIKNVNDNIRFFNVIDGFEGNPDSRELDGGRNGWKFLGMPWKTMN